MSWLFLLFSCNSDDPYKTWSDLAALKTPTAKQCHELINDEVFAISHEFIPYAKSLCQSSDNPTCLMLSCQLWTELEPVAAGGLLQHARAKGSMDRIRKQTIVRGLLTDKKKWQTWVSRALPKKRSNWLGAAIAELDCDPQLGRAMAARMNWRCHFNDEVSAKTLLNQAKTTAPARPEHTSLLNLASKLHHPTVTPYLLETLLNPGLDIYQQRSAAVTLSILEADGFKLPETSSKQLLTRCTEHPKPELTSFCQIRLKRASKKP